MNASTSSLTNDWAAAQQALLAINNEGKHFIRKMLLRVALAFGLACLFHWMGWLPVNIVLGLVAMGLVVTYGFQPFALALVALGSMGYAGASKSVDLAPGLRQGFEALGRLVNAALLFTGLTFGLFGTLPLEISVYGYLLLLMGLILLVSLIIYERIQTGKWLWKIAGTYIFLVVLAVLLSGIPLVREIFGYTSDTVSSATETIAEARKNGTSIFGDGNDAQNVTSAPAVNYVPVDRKVYGYIAPITLEPGHESIAITDFVGSCIYWDVTGGPDPVLLSADKNNIWMVGWKPGQHQIRFRNDSKAVVVVSPERRIGSNSCL